VGKPEGKRPLGIPKRRWEDNIKMNLQEVGGGCGDCIELAQDRDRWRALVSMVKPVGFHKNAGNFLTTCKDWLASQEGLCSMELVSKEKLIEFELFKAALSELKKETV
jgi:hypothetical protein